MLSLSSMHHSIVHKRKGKGPPGYRTQLNSHLICTCQVSSYLSWERLLCIAIYLCLFQQICMAGHPHQLKAVTCANHPAADGTADAAPEDPTVPVGGDVNCKTAQSSSQHQQLLYWIKAPAFHACISLLFSSCSNMQKPAVLCCSTTAAWSPLSWTCKCVAGTCTGRPTRRTRLVQVHRCTLKRLCGAFVADDD